MDSFNNFRRFVLTVWEKIGPDEEITENLNLFSIAAVHQFKGHALHFLRGRSENCASLSEPFGNHRKPS